MIENKEERDNLVIKSNILYVAKLYFVVRHISD